MIVALLVRILLVILFLPFSALDKILNFEGAVGQARELTGSRLPAMLLIIAGLSVEILMPLGILTGTADRLAGFIMSGYCVVTALLWKQFWRPGDFWSHADGKARGLFWDFLKNCSLAGGFLLITFTGITLGQFVAHPFSSSHPYGVQP